MARKNKENNLKASKFIPRPFLAQLIPLLLRVLVVVILIGFAGGIIKTFFDLRLLLYTSVEIALRQLLLNVITLLAVVEVVRTVMSYLSEGRVKVTYIVDTVLIVMLNEVISLWFKGPDINSVISLGLIITILIFVRLLAIKFSPDTD
jgi:uncharacterized membrane protein (DUF373 family)